MARVDFTLYSVADGTPLNGAAATVASAVRINADNTVNTLSPPAVQNPAGSAYFFVFDDSLLLPGSTIRYVIDATAASSSRYLDGEVNEAGPVTAAPIPSSVLFAGQQVFMGQGDQYPSLVFQLLQAGNPVDLSTGSPAVVFSMAAARLVMPPNSSPPSPAISNQPCSIVDAVNGQVLMAWPAGSTANPGDFYGQFLLTQNGLQSSYPVGQTVEVRIQQQLV